MQIRQSTGKLRNKWVNSLSANPTKWSSTPKQFVGNLPSNCLSVFDHFVGLALKGLRMAEQCQNNSDVCANGT